MSRLAFVIAFAAAVASAQTHDSRDAPRRLSDDSRWASFVHLVEARWQTRTAIVGEDEGRNRRLANECVTDAWYLSLPSLVASPASPCGKLVAALPEPKEAKAREREKKRESYRAAFTKRDLAPTREQYVACATDAIGEASAELLGVCALALEPRATLMASLTDDNRFGGWLASCKRVMLVSTKSDPKATRRASDDDEARHCLRTLPTLYEVQWMKNLSDFWTPEELRALRQRSEELGRDATP